MNAVRSSGSIPATIAIINGKIKVGLNNDDINILLHANYIHSFDDEIYLFDANQDDEIRKRSQELYEKIINLFELVINKGIQEKEFIHVDSRMTAIYILSVFQGINWFCIFNDKKLKAENYIRDSIEMIISGLCKT